MVKREKGKVKGKEEGKGGRGRKGEWGRGTEKGKEEGLNGKVEGL